MRTLHPLNFVRLKQELSQRRQGDPLKAPKDRMQAEVVRQLWGEYLCHLEPGEGEQEQERVVEQ